MSRKDVLPGSSQGKANNNVLDARKGDYSSKRNFTSSTVKKGNSTGLKKSHLDKTTYSGLIQLRLINILENLIQRKLVSLIIKMETRGKTQVIFPI